MSTRADKSPAIGAGGVGFEARFRDALTVEVSMDKPDKKDADLSSPVSTLKCRGSSAVATPANSSGSSSSGSVSGKPNSSQLAKAIEKESHSGELSGASFTSPSGGEKVRSTSSSVPSRPGHRRSASVGSPLIYSGKGFGSYNAAVVSGCNGASSAAVSSGANLLPAGNICPSGKISKPVMAAASRKTGRNDVLGSGTGNYGHGSIMRGHARFGCSGGNSEFNVVDTKCVAESVLMKKAMMSLDPEEVKNAGNEMYRKGNFGEALGLYDRAISMCSENAAFRSNKAAALASMGRLGEAVIECEEAVRLDYGYLRAHQRLAALYLRLGFVEQARNHLRLHGHQPDPTELHKLHTLEKHLKRCADTRKIEDWKSTLIGCDAAIAAGADSSPLLIACKSEALVNLCQLDEAESNLSKISSWENGPPLGLQVKVFGMVADAYVLHVRAQLEMAFGRFENAISLADKARLIDSGSPEVMSLLNKVKLVANARSRGNNLFKSGKYAEARLAYEDGLKHDMFNSVLYCNRAVCWSKLGMWKQCIEDCNQALKVQPHYTKALLRRAASNEKLQRWAEAVRDYEVLIVQLPGDNEVAELLSKAQSALKKYQEDDVKFSGEVEKITSIAQFKAAVSSSSHGVSVVYFKEASNQQCEQISTFVNTLCLRYPSVSFLKVDVEESPTIARTENIKIIPTFKLYKNGCEVKQMVSPSHQVLENSVRHYSL
ncbi:hypothetical protein QQ045_026540 [Rhodiola kirilowii]